MDAYRWTIEINLVGTLITCSHFVHRRRQNSDGTTKNCVIVNVASIAASEGRAGQATYASSKGESLQ